MPKEKCILAIDPGTDKCGMAVLGSSGTVLEKKIFPCRSVEAEIVPLFSKHQIEFIIVGYGTGRKIIEKELSRFELKNNIIFVSEKNTTWEARKRYWKDNPPKGLWKILPTTLRVPPVPVDDYAAIILAEKFLKEGC